MNDLFKDRLAALDDTLLDALKELFRERIEKEKPLVEKLDDDQKLGQKYRAYEQAKDILTYAFTDLETYRVKKDINKTFNKER